MAIDRTMREQATGWAVRTGDPEFTDWDGFTAWLEADADHAQAYDQVIIALDDAAAVVADDRAAPVPANDDLPKYRPLRRAWLGGAVAAGMALVAVVGVMRSGSPSSAYVTAPGETRTVAVGDGNTVTLAGGTRLVFDGKRTATLERGQALFEIRHDPARPFEVRAGDDRLVDIGTVFDVRRDGIGTVLSVAEGEVVFNPERQNVHVGPGQQAVRRNDSGMIERSAIAAEAVGEWRQGRITFRGASLSEVAAELTRASGLTFTAATDRRGSPVSGSVLIAPVRADPAALGPLLGVTVVQNGDSWIIEP